MSFLDRHTSFIAGLNMIMRHLRDYTKYFSGPLNDDQQSDLDYFIEEKEKGIEHCNTIIYALENNITALNYAALTSLEDAREILHLYHKINTNIRIRNTSRSLRH